MGICNLSAFWLSAREEKWEIEQCPSLRDEVVAVDVFFGLKAFLEIFHVIRGLDLLTRCLFILT